VQQQAPRRLRRPQPIDPAALSVLILVACLPGASNVAMLSERFGADPGRVARNILVSTALSFLSFSGAVLMLGKNG
jgi:malonate transporter and related proteins